jgi:hypothetical protein
MSSYSWCRPDINAMKIALNRICILPTAKGSTFPQKAQRAFGVGRGCVDAARLIPALFCPTTAIGRQYTKPTNHDAFFCVPVFENSLVSFEIEYIPTHS